ncbi:GNAT family N-acetyltransferase [Anaeromicrobium sediminis]|uniref:GNAT family N-acetyltransferase n=1 Tax=Anaeromicrobium sediminis TaxID=1478221 RepID=A0A267MBX3_9FIRM|nr:GNAT family N-acetyltransferase [Anaeromicrobium sediminis]PAB56892.1 GNAT family N-acetyltransferase [Anaeromicrobium sediminis]
MSILETERLILRKWTYEDVDDLFEYAKSDLVGPNAGWKPHKDQEESKEIIKMFIESDEVYAIELKDENKVIGSIGIHRRTPDEKLKDLKQREIGYVLNPKYWGNGYVPEATNALIKHGFEEMNLELIWCAHYDYNMRSKRVIEKSPFKYIFKRKEELKLLDNKKVTTLYHNLTKEEYYKNI